MKKLLGAIVISFLFAACNDSSVNVEANTDSLNKKLENVGEKLEDKAGEVWDSTKEKAGDLKDKAEQEWDSLKAKNRDRDTTK